MSSIYKKQKFLILSLLIYCFGITLYNYSEYFHQRNAGLGAINEQLLTTVGFAEDILRALLMHNHSDDIAITI